MSGKDYLQDIKTNLELGRNQHRMGETLLKAFGYVRRRATAIEEITATLKDLGLETNPTINSDMPLRKPRIIFSLKSETLEPVEQSNHSESNNTEPPVLEAQELEADDDINLPEPAFSVSELASANKDVAWVNPNATIHTAYTTMLLGKYSQLVVTSSKEPKQQDIKGIVSFQSIAKALMNGKPATVGDCIDNSVPFVPSDDDLKSVVSQLRENDVVLVIGRDKGLQGIVTAWDLAEEFAGLVDPFKRIGEIEERLRTLVGKRIGKDKVSKFLSEHGLSSDDPTAELDELTMGGLQRILEYPDHWDALALAFDRKVFIDALNRAREYRNRLMHFRDPLTEGEMAQLTNFCDIVREIQL